MKILKKSHMLICYQILTRDGIVWSHYYFPFTINKQYLESNINTVNV